MTRPRNEPAIAATWLMPSAVPRWCRGNASVRIAVALAISIAAPTAWTARKPMSHKAPADPSHGTSDRAMDDRAKTKKPRL